MSITVAFSEEPIRVLSGAGEFLASQPVLHNLILSILHARIARPEPGRYWVAMERDEAVGVVLQSPVTLPATLTPMAPEVAAALVDAIVASGVSLPGVNGHAATAASFAGQWAERSKSAATPFQGNRLYELLDRAPAPQVRGTFRQASSRDRDLIVHWTDAFLTEIGEPTDDVERRVDRGLAAGQYWVWEDAATLSMAVGRQPLEGVVRVSEVYTPPDKRNRGYAAACVHALSAQLRDAGFRAVLYTDLANPTANSIYRRIGYRAVAEVLRYRFDQPGGRSGRGIRELLVRKQYYFRPSSRGLLAWDVDRLVELSRKLPRKLVPLGDIRELDEARVGGDEPPTWRGLLEHLALIEQADLSFPIILSANGAVMDGMHRVAKAARQGRGAIEAVQFAEDPEPDHVGLGPNELPY